MKLVSRLEDLFAGSKHVQSVGLDCAGDDLVWDYARLNGFAIVTKDEDYDSLGAVRGFPPKVIWLQLGNCKTAQVEAAFRARVAELDVFEKDKDMGTFVISS